MKKIVALCLALFILLGVLIERQPVKAKQDTDQNVAEQLVKEYFEARNTLLVSGDVSQLQQKANQGVVEDEVSHRKSLVNAYSYEGVRISAVKNGSSCTEVTATESANGRDIEHLIEIVIVSPERGIVISDAYFDEGHFRSASYVDMEEAEQELLSLGLNHLDYLHIVNSSSYNGAYYRSLCLSTAYSQVGYRGKLSDNNLEMFVAPNDGAAEYTYTKYGAWDPPYHPSKWCAQFVSWCGYQAGISTSIIPKERWVADMKAFYNSAGIYYLKSSSYNPKAGDIFVMQGYDPDLGEYVSHVGLIYTPTTSYLWIVDGNVKGSDGIPQVRYRTISKTYTALDGYCSVNYCSFGHDWHNEGTYYRCNVCGTTASTIIVDGLIPEEE